MATKKTNTKKAAPRKKAAKKKTSAKASRAKPAKKANGKLSAINAAAKVLGETKKALNCKGLVEAMADKGYWKSPGGQTPDRTLYSAILREINNKGKQSRFKKADRGQFALNR
jgi:flagellar hook-length control protein FliK